MQFEARTSVYLKLLFPLLVMILLGVSPGSNIVSIKLQAARVAQKNKQHQAAADALRQAAVREPWRAGLWEQIGQEEYAAGRIEAAGQALQAASARGTLTPDGRFLLGEVLWQQRNLVAAEAAWQSLIADGNAHARVYERLAQLQRSRGDFSAAVKTLRSWRAAFPRDSKAAFLLGIHLSALQPADALPNLLDASRLDTGYTSAVQMLRGDLALAANSEQPAYSWLLIGRSLGSIGEWDLAQEAFQQSIAAAPAYAEAWAFLGEARSHLGSSGKMELEKARSLDPESVLVKALSAVALRRQGDFASALTYLQQIAAKEPHEPAWQVEIGNTLAIKGDLLGAYPYFRKAVELAPKNSQYWQDLVWFSLQYNYDVRNVGLPAARQAVQLAPNDPGALDAMGWTMATLGDSASAERFLQRALERNAAYAPANLHLGQIYLQQQNDDEAYFYLKIADGLDETGATGDMARRLLKRYFREDS